MRTPLDTSSLLSRSIEVLSDGALTFLVIALVVQSPQLFLVGWGGGSLGSADGDASPLAILILLLPLLVLTQIQAGLFAPGVAFALDGGKVSLRRCLPRSAAALVRILAAAVLVAVAAGCGFLFFLLPGWVVLTGFFVAVPALAVERLSPAAALGLSWKLTASSWISLFSLVFMFTVLERLLSLGLSWLGAPALVSALPAVPISALQAVAAGVAFVRLRHPAGGEAPAGPPAQEAP